MDKLWTELAAAQQATPSLRALFAQNPDRFAEFSAGLDDLLLDYSKTGLTETTRALLLQLAEATEVAQKRDAMFAGEKINTTENRAVLHTALRNIANTPVYVDGADVMPEVNKTFDALFKFAQAVRAGEITAADGGAFSDVINIGIGGSDLGPAMVTGALAPYHDGPRVHFVSNVDGAHLADTIRPLDPARTLIIVASKTFTTIETMTNAHSARQWIVEALGEQAVARHFAAVSTALDKGAVFGILPERTFGFWDWVGGRYSIWSAIGLPVMLAIGPENFREFLTGAHEMDQHFRTAPFANNLPVLLALTGIWHRNICGHAARAVLPYDQRLARFPAYLQQLDMESNGKRVRKDGSAVTQATGPLVWGEPGTNGQHAFYQLLHQGTAVIPCEFLIAAQGHEPAMREHHNLLIANCLAQTRALMLGRTLEEAHGNPHRVFPGNRPSVTIAYNKLTPRTLGRLIALYEHRVFVEAAIWGINAFDQWGVELGKELATGLLPIVASGRPDQSADSSTAGLVLHLTKKDTAP
ncbi:glucose-6-phosphate isomerase [Acidocella aquatica]|uniref:Glucose-6-phosphate isomerase n=1 Tax=Acidocella aquatica TaxID=1922313 RepID=A0ABQ6A5W8_9PROT|nr:glucose-6-phosphate isomerase [Acidocella aquatica]GLR65947.1 glucose-6-phosphate isomerase [Acidocella aquatica]